MPESGADILARIQPKLAEDWVEICLRPDLVAEFEELEAALEDEELATPAGPRRNSDKPNPWLQIIAEQIAAAEAEMSESAVRFTFRALPRDRFRALCDSYPPRKDDHLDLSVGYHRADVGDELVKASLVDPIFDNTAWAEFLDIVSIGEWNRLRERADKVNGSVVMEAPKSLLASRVLSQPVNA